MKVLKGVVRLTIRIVLFLFTLILGALLGCAGLMLAVIQSENIEKVEASLRNVRLRHVWLSNDRNLQSVLNEKAKAGDLRAKADLHDLQAIMDGMIADAVKKAGSVNSSLRSRSKS